MPPSALLFGRLISGTPPRPQGTTSPSVERPVRRVQFHLVTLQFLGVGYAFNAVFIVLFFGEVPAIVAPAYAFCGVLVNCGFYAASRRGWLEHARDSFAIPWQILANASIQIAFAIAVPELALLFAVEMFVVCGYGSLLLERISFVLVWVFVAVCSGSVILAGEPRIGLLAATFPDRLLFWLYGVLAIGRILVVASFTRRIALILRQRIAALEKSERRYRVLTSLSTDWFWELDAGLRFSAYSTRFRDRTGVAARVLGKQPWELPSGSVGSGQWAPLRAKFEQRASFRDFVVCIAGPTGHNHWMMVSGEPIFKPDGRFAGYHGVTRDVTKRMAVENALRLANHSLERTIGERDAALQKTDAGLRASEARLRKVLDLAPFHIFVKDRDGKCLLSNAAAAAVFGKAPEALVGKTIVQMGVRAEDAIVVERADREVRETGHQVLLPEFWMRDPSGRRRVFTSTRIAFDYSDEHPDAILVMSAEITALKEADEEIRGLNADLEARVQARTVELSAANREMEAFACSISHDLGAPVRAIEGFSRELLDIHAGGLDPGARKLIERIEAAGRRMGTMIAGLLALARTGRAPIRETSLDLSAMAKAIWADVIAAEPGRQVEFVLAHGLQARGDGALTGSLLQNLLCNAFKYSRHTRNARVEFGSLSRNGEPVFFVRDNGAGFDAAYASRLFGVFQRLHSEKEFEGTGIGLATVQRIAQRHGGRVWAETGQGAGATFFFTLEPRATPEAVE